MRHHPLRIAVFSIHSSPLGKLGTRYNGGMSVYVRELSHVLGKRGHAVDIYTGSTGEHPPGVLEMGEGVRLIHLAAGNGGTPDDPESIHGRESTLLSSLERFLGQEPPPYDLVHSHYWLSGSLGEQASRKWNLPHMLMFHTLGAVKNRSHPREREPELRLRVERELARSCTRILATTEKEKALIAGHCDVPPGKIGVVPCGVNLARFPLSDRSAARERLGLAQDLTLLLFVGRFAFIKGLDRLVSAMGHLKDRPGLRLILVGGDGPGAPETLRLKRQAREQGLESRVVFAGRVEQDRLPDHYAAADALVLPSAHESFGLVALEALACGTPVLASPVGVMETLLRDGTLGRLLPDTTPPRLAKTIDRFLASSRDRALSPREIREAVRPYGWSGVADSVLREYNEILKPANGVPGEPARQVTGGVP